MSFKSLKASISEKWAQRAARFAFDICFIFLSLRGELAGPRILCAECLTLLFCKTKEKLTNIIVKLEFSSLPVTQITTICYTRLYSQSYVTRASFRRETNLV